MIELDAVRARIARRFRELHLPATGKWLKDAGIGQTTIRNFLDGSTQSLTLDTVAKLERPLKRSAQWIVFGDEPQASVSGEQLAQMVGEALTEMQPGMTLAEIRSLVASNLHEQLGRVLAAPEDPDQPAALTAPGTGLRSDVATKLSGQEG
jgi:hypothetical protein